MKINVANVGDSRAVLMRNKTPVDLSSEHRVHGRGEIAKREIDRIHSAGGWVQDGMPYYEISQIQDEWTSLALMFCSESGRVLGQLMVSRAFGDWEFKDGIETLLQELREMGDNKAKNATITGPLITPTPDVTEIARTPEGKVTRTMRRTVLKFQYV